MPVRAVPPQKLTQEVLAGASMTVDVDSDSLTAEQRDVLRSFTCSGGTLPPRPKDEEPGAIHARDQITLDEKEPAPRSRSARYQCHDRTAQPGRAPVQCVDYAF